MSTWPTVELVNVPLLLEQLDRAYPDYQRYRCTIVSNVCCYVVLLDAGDELHQVMCSWGLSGMWTVSPLAPASVGHQPGK